MSALLDLGRLTRGRIRVERSKWRDSGYAFKLDSGYASATSTLSLSELTTLRDSLTRLIDRESETVTVEITTRATKRRCDVKLGERIVTG